MQDFSIVPVLAGIFSLLPIVGLFIALWAFSTYTQIRKLQIKSRECLSGIGIQLTRRSETIPNILTIAKKYIQHEDQLFSKIAAIRSAAHAQVDPKDLAGVERQAAAESELKTLMGGLFATFEAYPDLKSDGLMSQAINSYNEVENDIAASRRFFNATVSRLNEYVEIFPASVIASMLGATSLAHLTAPVSAQEPVNAADYL